MTTIPIRAVDAWIIERYSRTRLAEPLALTLSCDSAWSPRFQAEITHHPIEWPFPAWEYRQGDFVTFALSTIYRPRITLADISADHGGDLSQITAHYGGDLSRITAHYSPPWNTQEPLLPLSGWSARWGGDLAAVTAEVGGDLSRISALLRQPGGAYDPPPAETLTATMKVRSVAEDPATAARTYKLASADIRLHEYRRTSLWPSTSAYTSLRDLVNAMLSHLTDPDGTPTLELGPDLTIDPGLTWQPGATIWDTIHPTLEAYGWELFADLAGRWILRPIMPTPAPQRLDPDINLISYEADTDRATAFADGAIIEYSDTPTGYPEDRYDVYTMPGATRIMHETRAGPRPAPGAARELVERSRARGTTARARSTLALPLLPGQRIEIRRPTSPVYGTIQSLTHDYGAAETTYLLRDITTAI